MVNQFIIDENTEKNITDDVVNKIETQKTDDAITTIENIDQEKESHSLPNEEEQSQTEIMEVNDNDAIDATSNDDEENIIKSPESVDLNPETSVEQTVGDDMPTKPIQKGTSVVYLGTNHLLLKWQISVMT